MNSLRKRAEELRDSGYSYGMISSELGVAKATLSNWFHDRPFTPNQEVLDRVKYGPIKAGARRHNARVVETKKIYEQSKKEVGRLTERDLFMLGVGIYIGEGSKSIESTRIVNSDPAVIRAAIAWFRQSCGVPTESIIASLYLYPDIEEEDCIEYWMEATGLKRTNFRKSHFDERTGKRAASRGKLEHGTMQLRINANGNQEHGVVLFRRIKGWMDAALNQL